MSSATPGSSDVGDATPRLQCRGEAPGHRTDRAIETKFSQNEEFLEVACRTKPGGREDAERDRQIESRALLPHVGRGEADGDTPGGHFKAGVA